MSGNDKQDGQLIEPVQETSNNKAEEQPAAAESNTYITKTLDALSAKAAVKWTSIVVLAGTGLGFAVLLIYLGVYSYGNPDAPHCYYIDGLDETGLTEKAVITAAEE